jgi:hypothetical protein
LIVRPNALAVRLTAVSPVNATFLLQRKRHDRLSRRASQMTPQEQKAILAIAIHAAFADGAKDEREREEVRRVAENLADERNAPDLARLYQDVLLKRLPLATVSAMLNDTFQDLPGPAKQLQTQYLPQIQQKATTLDAGQVMALMRA